MRLNKTLQLVDGKHTLILDEALCTQMGVEDGSVLELRLDGRVLTVVPQENRISDAVFEKVYHQAEVVFQAVWGILK